MRKGRPYPPDRERRIRVKTELVRRDMTISGLARALGIHQGNLSAVINGTRISKKTEEKIAAWLGMTRGELFPPRPRGEHASLTGKGGAA
jgi:transcriptional regulator with XRE-family HTH domain